MFGPGGWRGLDAGWLCGWEEPEVSLTAPNGCHLQNGTPWSRRGPHNPSLFHCLKVFCICLQVSLHRGGFSQYGRQGHKPVLRNARRERQSPVLKLPTGVPSTGPLAVPECPLVAVASLASRWALIPSLDDICSVISQNPGLPYSRTCTQTVGESVSN